jgi:hypothetical protein
MPIEIRRPDCLFLLAGAGGSAESGIPGTAPSFVSFVSSEEKQATNSCDCKRSMLELIQQAATLGFPVPSAL